MTNAPDLIQAACRYARLGLKVLPLQCRKKRPITKHGVKDATTDLDQIRRWWNQHPRANVGIAVPRDYIVLDLDSEDALQVLRDQKLSLPATAWAKTGRGMHLWYATGKVRVKNRFGLFEDIDVKTSGGYVVAPPSVHPSGAVYRWKKELERSAIAPCPGWLLKKIQREQPSATSERKPKARSAEDWLRKVSTPVREGRRNQTLAEVAGYLFRHLPAEPAAQLAYCWAKVKLTPSLPENEISRTIESIAGCERRKQGRQP